MSTAEHPSPNPELLAGEQRERLLFRLLFNNKCFLIPTAVAYEFIVADSYLRSSVYQFVIPTILYTAFSLILIVLIWMAQRRTISGEHAPRYQRITNYLYFISFVFDAVFVFYLIFLPDVGHVLWVLFIPPMSIALLVPYFRKVSNWFMDGAFALSLLIVLYGMLYSYEMAPMGPRFFQADLLLCLSGLMFMWVNLRQISQWIEMLSHEINNLAGWNLLWNKMLENFPAESFLVNEQGEILIASEMARKLLLLPLAGQTEWPEASQPIRNALLLRFHAETPMDETIQLPDDEFPHPIKIYPTFFAVRGKRYCIALAQEQNPDMIHPGAILRSDRLTIAGQIAAGLAHELGNPLGVIQSCASYLKQKCEEDDPNIEEYKLIEAESKRCQNLIDRLLSLASPKRDTPGVHDLRDILHHSVSLVKYQAGKHPIELEFHYYEPVLIYANEGQVSAVFVNLFLNALQSMEEIRPEGKLVVHMRVRGNESIIDVTDEGTGITKEELAIIFDPFFTKRAEGTGLGLSIVHQIITSMGGRIDVASTVGSGTTFTVSLPLYEESNDMNPFLTED